MSWIGIIVDIFLRIVKSIFGTNSPMKNTVIHAEKEMEIDDGKTDEERIKDLGLR